MQTKAEGRFTLVTIVTTSFWGSEVLNLHVLGRQLPGFGTVRRQIFQDGSQLPSFPVVGRQLVSHRFGI